MKRSIAIAALFLAAFFPSVARAAEEAESPGSWLVLAFFAINFTIFVAIVARAAGPSLRKYFVDRAALIHSNLAKSEQAFKEAEVLARAAAERIAGLEQEVAKLAQELAEETAFQVRRVSELGKSNADRIRHDSTVTAAALVENAQRRVRERLAQVAAQLARDLIASHFDASDQSRLLQGFMEKLGEEARR